MEETFLSEANGAPAPLDPERPTLRRLVLGDDGLRAGWSLLLFLILAAGLAALSGVVIAHLHLLPKPVKGAPMPMTPITTIVGDGVTFGVVALAALVMSLIERRPFRRYGLTAKRMPLDIVTGLAWGVICLAGLVCALWLAHALSFDGVALHGSAAVTSGARWLLAFFLVVLAEEFLTRGYLQYTVSRGVAGIVRALSPEDRHAHAWGFWIAAFLFSVCLFMLGHIGNPGETAPGILAVGLAGAVFAYSLWRTGSLWWAIGFHTSWDWAQSYLFGVHDSGIAAQGHLLDTHPLGPALLSGGSTGPEGSVLVLPALLLVGVIIHLTLPRRAYFLTPDQGPRAQLPPTTGAAI